MGDYKNLRAWQLARDLAVLSKSVITRLPREERYALSDQWRRAVYSVALNIAEGASRRGVKDFRRTSTSRGPPSMKSRRSSNSSWRLSTFLRRNSRRYGRRATNVLGLCTGCCERYRMARRSLDGRTGGLAAYGLRLTAYSWLLLRQAV